jgi:hypothetical protein
VVERQQENSLTATADSELAQELIVEAVSRAAESVFSTMLGMSVEAQPPIAGRTSSCSTGSSA